MKTPRFFFMMMVSLVILSACSNHAADAEPGKTSTEVEHTAADMQNGDIIFQTSRSSQSQAIQLATNSPYSHMGLLYEKEGQFYVYEAAQTVQLTPLEEWTQRGEEGHYVIKRLKDADKTLTPETLAKMKAIGEAFRGKSYDSYFEWTDDRVYCSELVWKIYREGAGVELGALERLSDFDLSSEVVQTKIKERYGKDVPLNQNVISPAAVFESDRLITIVEN